MLDNFAHLGGWKYEDVNKDGVINDQDKIILGDPNPKLILGFNNDVTYKNFSASIFSRCLWPEII